MGNCLGVLVPLSVRDGEHVDGVVVVRVFVADEAKMRDRLVVLSAVDGERRRVQALIDGLRIWNSRCRLPLTDVEVQTNPFVQFLLFGILAQHRFQNGGSLTVIVSLERLDTSLVQSHCFKVGRTSLRAWRASAVSRLSRFWPGLAARPGG